MDSKPVKPRIARARDLRAKATDAERKLWAALGGRRLGGFKFRRQVPIDRYFADFACLEARLIVELDGSQHMERSQYDDARTAALEAHGWRVMRFWNNDVLENVDGVGVDILAALVLARP
jgi:very-short-patch-repair endonuclease